MNQSFTARLNSLEQFIVSVIEEKNKAVFDDILLGLIKIPEQQQKGNNELKESNEYLQNKIKVYKEKLINKKKNKLNDRITIINRRIKLLRMKITNIYEKEIENIKITPLHIKRQRQFQKIKQKISVSSSANLSNKQPYTIENNSKYSTKKSFSKTFQKYHLQIDTL